MSCVAAQSSSYGDVAPQILNQVNEVEKAYFGELDLEEFFSKASRVVSHVLQEVLHFHILYPLFDPRATFRQQYDLY